MTAEGPESQHTHSWPPLWWSPLQKILHDTISQLPWLVEWGYCRVLVNEMHVWLGKGVLLGSLMLFQQKEQLCGSQVLSSSSLTAVWSLEVLYQEIYYRRLTETSSLMLSIIRWLEVSYLLECGGVKEQHLYTSIIVSLYSYSVICSKSKINLSEVSYWMRNTNWRWWLTAVVSILQRLRQEDWHKFEIQPWLHSEFQDRLDYSLKPCVKKAMAIEKKYT